MIRLSDFGSIAEINFKFGFDDWMGHNPFIEVQTRMDCNG